MSEPATVETPVPVTTPDAALSALTPEQRDHWQLTGEFPAPPAEPKPSSKTPEAASTPAKPAEQAVSTDTSSSPASEPGTSQRPNAETRIKELLAENKRLKEQNARQADARPAPAPNDAQAASSTAAAHTLSDLMDSPNVDAPRLKDREFYAAFPGADMDDYLAYVTRYEVVRDRVVSGRQQEKQSAHAKFNAAIDAAIEADKSFEEALERVPSPVSLLRPGDTPTLANVAMEEVYRSSMPDKLISHLAKHPELIKGLTSERDAIRTIARLETTLTTPAVPLPPATPTRTTSKAPAPPQTLGAKAGDSVDDAESALAGGDVARYNAIMNAREARGVTS